jgi:secreted trypsin-like serine protease
LDAGSPLACHDDSGNYVLAGVLSYNLDCGRPLPSLYTRVSTFLRWVRINYMRMLGFIIDNELIKP